MLLAAVLVPPVKQSVCASDIILGGKEPRGKGGGGNDPPFITFACFGIPTVLCVLVKFLMSFFSKIVPSECVFSLIVCIVLVTIGRRWNRSRRRRRRRSIIRGCCWWSRCIWKSSMQRS